MCAPALGGVIEETGEPFMTDVYDLHEPLESLCAPSLGLALLGDSAHAITPHMAKGECTFTRFSARRLVGLETLTCAART